jgi:hypothetical protein
MGATAAKVEPAVKAERARPGAAAETAETAETHWPRTGRPIVVREDQEDPVALAGPGAPAAAAVRAGPVAARLQGLPASQDPQATPDL